MILHIPPGICVKIKYTLESDENFYKNFLEPISKMRKPQLEGSSWHTDGDVELLPNMIYIYGILYWQAKKKM